MIDLHCHLLPDVDDGSKNMDISLRLASEAVENGITHALLTPHHMNGVYTNHKKDVIKKTEEFQKELQKNEINLTVFPGQEVRINGELLNAIDDDDILFADEEDQYLMLEFPDNDVPTYTMDMIFKLQQRKIIPVIVHPERNTKIIKHPEILFNMLNKGCLSQITASSYVGTFGKSVSEFSREMIQADQGYVFSSDAHDLPGRKYEMNEAFEKMAKEFGASKVNEYMANAKAIINGERVLQSKIFPITSNKKHFWGFFK